MASPFSILWFAIVSCITPVDGLYVAAVGCNLLAGTNVCAVVFDDVPTSKLIVVSVVEVTPTESLYAGSSELAPP